MRKLDFPNLIKEEIEELQKVEKEQTVARLRMRVQFLRFLKRQTVSSIKEAAKLVGITPKCGYEWWNLYKENELPEYLKLHYQPCQARLSVLEQEHLIKRAGEENGFASQVEVRKYVEDEFGVTYTQAGMSLLLGRLKIKAKVPRPRNQGANQDEQSAYKKTFVQE
jgi:transposase